MCLLIIVEAQRIHFFIKSVEFNSYVQKFDYVCFRFYLRSGNVEHLSDKFYNTTVGVLPIKNVVANQNFTQEGFVTIGHFDSLGIAEGNVDPRLGKVLAVRITVQSDSDTWVILSEVSSGINCFNSVLTFFLKIVKSF